MQFNGNFGILLQTSPHQMDHYLPRVPRWWCATHPRWWRSWRLKTQQLPIHRPHWQSWDLSPHTATQRAVWGLRDWQVMGWDENPKCVDAGKSRDFQFLHGLVHDPLARCWLEWSVWYCDHPLLITFTHHLGPRQDTAGVYWMNPSTEKSRKIAERQGTA